MVHARAAEAADDHVAAQEMLEECNAKPMDAALSADGTYTCSGFEIGRGSTLHSKFKMPSANGALSSNASDEAVQSAMAMTAVPTSESSTMGIFGDLK